MNVLSYRGLLIAAAVAGIGVGVAGCSGSTPAASVLTTSSAPTTTASAGTHKGNGPHGVAGTISAENGSTWTVTTKAGKQVTVDITSTTKFGTTQAPAMESQFAVGAMVRVDGTISGTTVTATRVAVPTKPPTSSSPVAPPTTTTG